MKQRIFVYGALRKGASNAWRMKDATWISTANVQGTLVKVDWYPGLVLLGTTQVQGEVYEVDEETLKELDEFEGIGVDDGRSDEYRRIEAHVNLDSGEGIRAFLYEWQLGIDAYEVVEGGDWLLVDLE